MYLVFLDIDGVLATKRTFTAFPTEYDLWAKFDPVAVDFFNWIHDNYDVQFVVMSTWKRNMDGLMSIHWVNSCLQNSGFRGTLASPWRTNPKDDPHVEHTLDRAHQVKAYIDNAKPDDFILFDDNSFHFKDVLGKGRLIQTHAENGLLVSHMNNAKALMGGWNKKNGK